jgi:hypothetical protein
MRPTSVWTLWTGDAVIDELGVPVAAWVVIVDDQDDDSLFTALFVDSQHATDFAASEVGARLEYCDCF